MEMKKQKIEQGIVRLGGGAGITQRQDVEIANKRRLNLLTNKQLDESLHTDACKKATQKTQYMHFGEAHLPAKYRAPEGMGSKLKVFEKMHKSAVSVLLGAERTMDEKAAMHQASLSIEAFRKLAPFVTGREYDQELIRSISATASRKSSFTKDRNEYLAYSSLSSIFEIMRTDSNISDREVAMALVTAYERLKENLVEMVKVVYPVYNALLVYGASIGAGPDDDTKRAGNKSGNATIMADKQYRG